MRLLGELNGRMPRKHSVQCLACKCDVNTSGHCYHYSLCPQWRGSVPCVLLSPHAEEGRLTVSLQGTVASWNKSALQVRLEFTLNVSTS